MPRSNVPLEPEARQGTAFTRVCPNLDCSLPNGVFYTDEERQLYCSVKCNRTVKNARHYERHGKPTDGAGEEPPRLFALSAKRGGTNWVLNTAIIPDDGEGMWRYIPLDRNQAVAWLRKHPDAESRVGYPETQAHIREIASVTVALSREETRMKVGDVGLVVRLKYRVTDPTQKGRVAPSIDDFVYGLLVRL